MKKNILILVLGALAMGSQAVQYKYEGFDYGADTGLRYQPGIAYPGPAGCQPIVRAALRMRACRTAREERSSWLDKALLERFDMLCGRPALRRAPM